MSRTSVPTKRLLLYRASPHMPTCPQQLKLSLAVMLGLYLHISIPTEITVGPHSQLGPGAVLPTSAPTIVIHRPHQQLGWGPILSTSASETIVAGSYSHSAWGPTCLQTYLYCMHPDLNRHMQPTQGTTLEHLALKNRKDYTTGPHSSPST